jgi:hypothetical protein
MEKTFKPTKIVPDVKELLPREVKDIQKDIKKQSVKTSFEQKSGKNQ